jgi:hypothetical protein
MTLSNHSPSKKRDLMLPEKCGASETVGKEELGQKSEAVIWLALP